MKEFILTVIFCLFAASASADDKNLIPLFGSAPKTAQELSLDQKFVEDAVAAAGTKEKAAAHMIMRGQEALQKNDPETAIKRFNQAYLLDPKDYKVYWGLGAARGEQRKFAEAIKLIEKAESINDKDARLLSDHGFALVSEVVSSKPDQELAIKNFTEAEQLYRKAIKLSPKESLPYSRLAVLMYYKGDFNEAHSLVDQCRIRGGEGLDPNFIRDLAKAEAGE